MSVAYLSAAELGVFAGISVKLKLQTLAEACEMAAALSESNCAAFFSQYGELEEAHSADAIEAEALRALASPTGLQRWFGPVIYNCIDNEGGLFFGQMRFDKNNMPPAPITATLESWTKIEEACRKFREAEEKRIARQAEDDAAYAEVGPLPKLTADQIREEMTKRGATRLIVAQFNVDTSEAQSDYFGSRTARQVVIGFGTGSRESFPQMRKAAALFPPTAEFAPGCNVYTAQVVLQNDVPTTSGRGTCYYKGFRSPWHNDIGHGRQFTREADAQAFVDAAPAPNSVKLGDTDEHLADFAWEIGCESVEHRENYSMGGGNYLGHGRYSGWKVSQTTYIPNEIEYFEAPAILKKPRASKPMAKPTAPEITVADQYSANV